MNWKKGIAFGVLLWVIMFALVSALIAVKLYKSADPGVMSWVVAIIGGVVSYLLAGSLKPDSTKSALLYGLFFVVVGLILDALITVRFNPGILSYLSLWFSYALIWLAPLLRVQKTAPPPVR